MNDWLLDRWLEPDTTNRFRGTIRVNPEDPKGAVAEIERLAAHPKLVQVGVPLQSQGLPLVALVALSGQDGPQAD